MGALYASFFDELNPGAVNIIADERRAAAIKRDGITVNGKKYHFKLAEPGEAQLIIIAVKYPDLQDAIAAVKPFVAPDTIVISLLNGISSEAEIGKAIGQQHLLYAYGVGMDAEREQNNINYHNPGKLVFGEKYNQRLSPRVKLVKAFLEEAKIPQETPEDMERALWFKFMINTGINQVSAVTGGNYGLFQRNEYARSLMIAASREVITLAKKLEIGLTDADLDKFLEILQTLNPAGKTSMLQDVEAGRKTEIELFAGEVIALGEKNAVHVPVNQTLYQLIRARETA